MPILTHRIGGTMAVRMNRRMLHISVLHIDTNLINARQKLESVNQLERWYADEVILINMSSIAHAEAQADGNERRTRKANSQIFTVTPAAGDDDPDFKQVETALFPQGAEDKNQRNDVRIICETARYGAILVTSDGASKSQPGGILGNRDKLRHLVRVMSPDEAVDFVRDEIRDRDKFNERVLKEFGGELPPWTGKD